MNRFLKWILILAGVLMLLAIVAAIALPMFFDGEELKRRISTAVTEQTGRELRIEGELGFSVFPMLALEVNQLWLGNAKGFGDGAFAEIGQARAGVGLMPLFRKEIRAQEIVLKGLHVNLTVNERGISNWEDLISEGSSQASPGSPTGSGFSSPQIEGLNISDATIDYEDRQADIHYRLDEFSLATGALGGSGPVPVKLAMAVQDLNANSRLEMELKTDANFDAKANALNLPNVEMRLDESKIRGQLDLTMMDAALPTIRFDLDMDQIDLDHYLAETPTTDSGPAESEAVPIPQEELAGLDVEGTLRIQKVTALDMALNDVEFGLKIKDQVLRLHPLQATFYGGKYNGDITLNAAGAKPRLSLNEKIDSVTFASMAKDLLDYDQVSGSAHGSLQASGSGKTSDELINNLTGTLELRLDEGALEGIDIWYEIRKGVALLKGQPAPANGQGRTVFSRMNVDGSLGQGKVNLETILAELPFLTVKGNGTVDLNSTALDIEMVAGVLSSPELSQDPLAADLEGRSVPFRISGQADDPKIKVDVENLLKGEAAKRLMDKLGLGQETGDTTEQGEDSTEQAVKGLLGGLLGGKKKKEDEKDDDGGG